MISSRDQGRAGKRWLIRRATPGNLNESCAGWHMSYRPRGGDRGARKIGSHRRRGLAELHVHAAILGRGRRA